ncbi:phosphonatase-like hydrolase [Rhodococcus sp. BP-316]|uniref:phosphonatase-like hydrolase n=1 Tax=unclassified Rhodococcus (in: high G+C Gram-positive bacteria) TaxID=192944 RepID=UPI001C9A5CDD|nr:MULTISPECIES: phosphonatase-like hydrolase [unclassified Rhodococcus (in: high G+C Gram-positive bacteria)]MBY6678526.1 phosphonatase-like hydrolase [Rhodococcus sp. BP-332]MBY6682108.1 phosphonatase-like hydrolase [Rhodococcus sp. BP-316]
MTARSFDLACLDMAGTTVDEGGLVYTVLAAAVSDATNSSVSDELLSRWKGTGKREAIVGLLDGLGASTDDRHVDVVFDDFTTRLTEAYRETPPSPVPGVPDALRQLRERGVKVGLQTGYSAGITKAILDGLGWTVGTDPRDTVDAVITSDTVPASRPAPYLIFRCMEATGVVDVRRVLVAGDTPNDVLAGHHAGAGFVVGVLSGSFDAAALSAATHVLPSVVGAVDLL